METVALNFFPITLRDSISMRPFTENDAESFYRAVDKNRHFLAKYIPWAPGMTAQKAPEFLRLRREHLKNATSICCGVFKESISGNEPVVEDVIGHMRLKKINWQTKWAELAYWLVEDYCGSGLCTLASKKLIEFGRAAGIHTFATDIVHDNLKSQAVARRLGFQKLPGVIWKELHGVDVLHVVFELRFKETDFSSD